MPRYFIEVAYKGTNYSGFQIQENSNTIQEEIEKAITTIHKQSFSLTGSSRTDAGVHAFQNFFHFDSDVPIQQWRGTNGEMIYKLNAILPLDIVIKNIVPVHENAHCRFDAISREYEYKICRTKNPFASGFSYYYPYKLNVDLMNQAAQFIQEQTNFISFTKTNSQVKNFNCTIIKCQWINNEEILIYTIEANRFLRGMIRLLTAAMLQVGRNKISIEHFTKLFNSSASANRFLVPAEGLFLKSVNFPQNYSTLSKIL